MKKIVAKTVAGVALLLAGGLFSGGCATPVYSPVERGALIARTWDYEFKQAVDDFDHVMLLRPPSRLTVWHVQ